MWFTKVKYVKSLTCSSSLEFASSLFYRFRQNKLVHNELQIRRLYIVYYRFRVTHVSHSTLFRGPSSVSYPTFLTFECFDQTFFQKNSIILSSYPFHQFSCKNDSGNPVFIMTFIPAVANRIPIDTEGVHQTSAF